MRIWTPSGMNREVYSEQFTIIVFDEEEAKKPKAKKKQKRAK